MNWQNIRVSDDNTYFLFEENPILNKVYIEVLKFHSPGLAPVIDKTGAYHIDICGEPIYSERYTRSFGYYSNRAAVISNKMWFHINEIGEKIYSESYSWVGNYQENICTVRDTNNMYFHIDLNGNRIYSEDYIYAGDFKEGIACVKETNGYYKHMDSNGKYINDKNFLDLGIFHKNFATAKDENGWHHIDKKGENLYTQRYLAIEPFYNGFSLVTKFDCQKCIINEKGMELIDI